MFGGIFAILTVTCVRKPEKFRSSLIKIRRDSRLDKNSNEFNGTQWRRGKDCRHSHTLNNNLHGRVQYRAFGNRNSHHVRILTHETLKFRANFQENEFRKKPAWSVAYDAVCSFPRLKINNSICMMGKVSPNHFVDTRCFCTLHQTTGASSLAAHPECGSVRTWKLESYILWKNVWFKCTRPQ